MSSAQPIRTILAATDLQKTSRGVCDTALRLARAADARLLLLHVVETKDSWLVPDAFEQDAPRDEIAQARRALDVQAEELDEGRGRVESDVLEGHPTHQLIIDRLGEEEADLLVVGSSAREGHGHRLGSTADRLLRSTPVPCLVVRSETRPPFRRIALLTDFSDRARHAVRATLSWRDVLADSGARFDVVHVGEQVYRSNDPSLEEHLKRKLDEEVAELDRETGGDGLGSVLHWARHPVDGALEVAEQEGHDLLVVSTHGHGAIRRALVGSVAMGLAQSSTCPVLVVPAPDGD